MNKKILIVNNNMHIGGVQRALINLLKCVQDKYDVTLALFNPNGALMTEIPEGVKIMPVNSAYRFLGMSKYDVEKKPVEMLLRSFFATITRLVGRKTAVSIMALSQKKITGYDVVISYLHNPGDKVFYGGCNEFVCRHVDAPRRYAFLHCDYLNSGANTLRNKLQYSEFDGIAACSEGCRNSFVQAIPEFAGKTVVVQNCQDYGAILRMADAEPVQLPSDRINILTVARMGREKGIPRAIRAFARLNDFNVHYYVIGDGTERSEVERLIQNDGIESRVTLLGEMTNPYGYMKAADLLLLPSISEAAPMVIGEAACLGTPILTTETTSAIEMVEDTGFGWVCSNSVAGIENSLRAILEDEESIQQKKSCLQQIIFGNAKAMGQFEELLDGAVTVQERERK